MLLMLNVAIFNPDSLTSTYCGLHSIVPVAIVVGGLMGQATRARTVSELIAWQQFWHFDFDTGFETTFLLQDGCRQTIRIDIRKPPFRDGCGRRWFGVPDRAHRFGLSRASVLRRKLRSAPP